MPLVLSVDLPTADCVVVVPGEGRRVIVFVDPRVPLRVAADTVMQVREAIHGRGELLSSLAKCTGSKPYALG